MEFERRCWAEVDLGALRHNFKLVRERAGDATVMAVVKADAYGHGDAVVAPLLEQEGADQFAVSGFGEAVCLRRAGVTKPILILGYTGVQNAAALAVGGISQTVFSLEYARALSEAALRAGVAVRVHLKVDTGMGRIGFTADDDMERAVAEMAEACALPGLVPVGVFTHFAAADSTAPEDIAYTRRQYLRAAVSMVKELAAGDAVSYGCTFRAPKPMRAATLAVGYADGYPRALSGRGTVSLHGRPARVLGRVCMDQIVVDVTDIPDVKAGDAAIVFGGGAADSVDDVARMTGTINYEVLCDVGRRVQRVYVENGAEVELVDYLKGE